MNDAADILQKGLEKLKDDIIARHVAAGQKASGRSADAFEVKMSGELWGELWGPKYAGVFETGRKAGKAPYDFKNIIMDWAAAKGISFPDRKSFERWASAVAWKIRREGTAMYRTGKTEDIFDTPIREFEEYLTNELGDWYSANVANLIFSQFDNK
jgi:hypothetical protein